MDCYSDYDTDISSESVEILDSFDSDDIFPDSFEEDSFGPLGLPEDDTDLAEKSEVDLPEDINSDQSTDSSDQWDWERTSLSASEEAVIQEMIENGEIEIPEEDITLAEPEHSKLHLPDASGEFSGERGNSDFTPFDEAAKEIMAKYEQKSVSYKDGYPDFSPFTTHRTPWGDLNCQVEIGHMTDQRENPKWEFGDRPRGAGHDPKYDLGNFAQADNSLLDRLQQDFPDASVQDVVSFRKDNHLTWHECADGKTMQLVPSEIHDACRHSGGVSEMKYRMAWGDVELPIHD